MSSQNLKNRGHVTEFSVPDMPQMEHPLTDKPPFDWDDYSLSIIANINMWLNAYDRDLNLVVWNPVAERISGYSREEVIGHDLIWTWLYPDEAYREFIMSRAGEDSLISGTNTVEGWETEITCKNGTIKSISWNSRALFDAEGEFQGILTIGQDVTGRKQAEEQTKRLAVAEERRRLARELHDAVTQSLYSAALFAEAGQRSIRSGEYEDADTYLTSLRETAQYAVSEMRLLLHELRPLDLEENGLLDAIQRRLDAVERRIGIKVRLIAETNLNLPEAVEQELYRVAQEAFNNTLRHASADNLIVNLSKDAQQVVMSIEDDGVGFCLATAKQQGGMGLQNMRERVEQLGGTFRIDTSPGQGVSINISIEG